MILIRIFTAAMLFVVIAAVSGSVLFPVAVGVLWAGWKLCRWASRVAEREEDRRYRRAVIDRMAGPRP